MTIVALTTYPDSFSPMLGHVPRNWVPDVHQYYVPDGNDHQLVDPGDCRDVQRYEFALGKREFVEAPSLEKSVPRGCYNFEYGSTLR